MNFLTMTKDLSKNRVKALAKKKYPVFSQNMGFKNFENFAGAT
jgi:hypothetical protein